MTEDVCIGMNVFPGYKCYAVSWQNEQWKLFFNRTLTDTVLVKLYDSIIVHFWNALSFRTPVSKGDGSAYDTLAGMHCPLVYSQAGEFF